MHHERALLLVLQVLPERGRLVVPHLQEAIHRAGDAVLAIRRERGALRMRFVTEFDGLRDLRWALLFLCDRVQGHAAEHINPLVRWQQPCVLLPLHGMAHKGEQPRRRSHGDVLCNLRRDRAAPLLLRLAFIRVPRIKMRLLEQVLYPQIPLWVILLHGYHRPCLAKQVHCRLDLSQLTQLKDDLAVELHLHMVWQAQIRNSLQHDIPTPVVDIAQKAIYGVDSVQGHTGLLLHCLQCPMKAIFLAELEHEPDNVGTLHGRSLASLRHGLWRTLPRLAHDGRDRTPSPDAHAPGRA
mmetsp:Transcript_89668/g.231416  ORF Transcript_89668/g.231416 Transcript_89668/m.231416 type:complete len:296 (+) Transcript_89668:801-1688(+)